jgi:hypothetical protein
MPRRVASHANLIAAGVATTASPGGPQACEARPHRGKAIIVSSAEDVPRPGRRSSLISCRRGWLEPVGSEPTSSAFSMKTPALLEQRRGVNYKPAFPPECSPDICHSSRFALAHKGLSRGQFPVSRQADPSPAPALRR